MPQDEQARNIINQLKIASPCPMEWDAMERTPEDAVRFCGECKKNVYNVSQMSASEANNILQSAMANGTGACMQLYRRADGTVITDDCPVGLRRVRDMWRKVRSVAAGFVAVAVSSLPGWAQGNTQGSTQGKPGCAPALKGDVYVPPQAERGKPMQLNPAMLGGAVAPMNWYANAMAVPSVKKIDDQIQALLKKGKLSDEESLRVNRLRLEMAQEADRKGVTQFANEELTRAQAQAEVNPERKELLIEILKARLDVYKKLKISNTSAITDKLKSLGAKY